MRLVSRSLRCALAACALLGCRSLSGEPETVPTPADPFSESSILQSGADLYMRYCASCHGATAQGDGPTAASLKKPPSDLTRLSARWGDPLDQDRLAEFLDGRNSPRAHGTAEMPVWGERLYRGEREESPAREAARRGTILLILEYLQTRQQPAAAPPS